MARVLECLRQGARVAVVRLRSLGDCVLTTPALDILHDARPDLAVAVVVEDRFRPVFEGNPAVAALVPPAAAVIRAWKPDLVLNLHGGSTSARLTALSGARFRAGFAHFRHRFVYNVKIPRAQEILQVERKVHTAEHLASAMFYLGAPGREIPRARLYADPPPAGRPYAVIHPVASEAAKTWPAEHFLATAEHLDHALDLEPVFIAGPSDDMTPFRRYRTIEAAPLAEVKTLLRGAALFLGNDSGPAHMAAAFGLPVVVIFGSSDADVWHPWKTASEVLCSPEGIAAIPPVEAIEALERLRVRA
ncbi:MAG TPA: glycosyltransferase family 9 protein [Bryobacteraceae bacterium]|nr:glycosyltransferase family 9 protein [Bryobacteraceae bacterium]